VAFSAISTGTALDPVTTFPAKRTFAVMEVGAGLGIEKSSWKAY
jgi:hypothetical protein